MFNVIEDDPIRIGMLIAEVSAKMCHRGQSGRASWPLLSVVQRVKQNSLASLGLEEVYKNINFVGHIEYCVFVM